MGRMIGASLYAAIAWAWASAPAAAATFCVGTPNALRDALSTAATNGEDDTIQIVRGTYAAGGAAFSYVATEAHSLSIFGGYNSDCSRRRNDPRLSVLDGGDASLVLETESTQGEVELRYLTIQHGYSANITGAGLRMNFFENTNGPMVVDANIFRANHAGSGHAFSIGMWGTATLEFNDNLVVDNLADTWPGGAEVYCNGGAAHFTNNTFANNTGDATDSRTVGGFDVYGPHSASFTFSNNIFWGNSGFDLLSGSGILANNDYGSDANTPPAGSSGNLSVAPRFVGNGDYHLKPSSPVLRVGTLTPVGGLPGNDIEGHDRTDGNTVDLGAYERGDKIFVSAFDI